jgi:hypothetical protein
MKKSILLFVFLFIPVLISANWAYYFRELSGDYHFLSESNKQNLHWDGGFVNTNIFVIARTILLDYCLLCLLDGI